MLGQEFWSGQIGPYTDPWTGYVVTSDEQAYADASVALVQANQTVKELVALVKGYGDFFQQAQGSGYPVPDAMITLHADLLTEQQTVEQHQAALQDYVTRYRYYTYGSGLRGLRGPILILVGVAIVASAIGYFTYRKFNAAEARNVLQSNTLNYQKWLAEQVQQGLLDPETAQTLSQQATQTVQEASGFSFGGLFAGIGGAGLAVLAGVVILAFTRR